MSDELKISATAGTTGQPSWMNEKALGNSGGISWNDLAGIMAMTFHTATTGPVTDDQIINAFYGITGWMLESDLGGEAMPEFAARVREMIALCEKDRDENGLSYGCL